MNKPVRILGLVGIVGVAMFFLSEPVNLKGEETL